jgi:hypothetical protein
MLCKSLIALTITLLNTIFCSAQTIPSPKEHFGFNIGDDYQLANYTQTEAYFKKLAAASDRTKLVDIGLTEEGRHQYMLIVSSAANTKNLDRYKQISQKLARAEDITDEQAHVSANEGKAIVWIDGGLHATEVVGAHQLIETIYQLVSRTDAETLRILDQAIILFTHANPDGQELVSNWYMRDSDVEKRKTNIPRLYEKYIGHDNNRDFFMMNMKETQNISRQQYIEWMPQIIYNHHQAGPAGSVVAGPPYRDPFNYAFDPLLVTSIDAVGAAMNNRLNLEGKPGYTQRAGSNYSTWWNGGLRTTGYFHNMVGLLTEIIGSPTPAAIPLVPSRLIPNGATPNPVAPQQWHFRQSIDYSVSLNYAVLNYAVNQKHDLLYGIYKMGRNSIEKGNRDNWTLSPRYADSISNAYKKDQKTAARQTEGERTTAERDTIPTKYFNIVYKDSSLRDARGYIIPAGQPDFATAVKFINALIYSGIAIHKATADFTVAGKTYPSGSYIVKTDQAFRPHVIDMFEPQDHPNDFQYAGGPPIPPYDAAGWTLAYNMGVQFDRVLTNFEGPFQKLAYGNLQSLIGQMSTASAGGYVLSAASNNSFIAVNDLVKQGIDVYRLPATKQSVYAPGSFYVPANAKTRSLVAKYAQDLGLKVTGLKTRPAGTTKVEAMRIALWDAYGGSIPSGWLRWIMEQYHFRFNVIYAKEIDTADLRKSYDVIVFVGGAIPAVRTTGSANRGNSQPKPEDIPAEFRNSLGRISPDTSIPKLKRFMQDGGTIVAIGSSTNLAYHIGLPVRNALVEMNNGQERTLPGEKFYIPGSIMRVTIDTTRAAAYGMRSKTDVYFDASPVFKPAPGAIASGDVKPIAWFETPKPLRSGWAWGQAYLQDGVAAFEAPVGAGKLVAFGPEITFRGQAHGTFKLLFNQLYGGGGGK